MGIIVRALIHVDNKELNLKAGIIDLLKLLASEDEQLAYQKNVPHVDIAAELVSRWFDDLCHPNDNSFISSFGTEELEALAAFHRFYNGRVNQLPESEGTIRIWLGSPIWREVMRKAKINSFKNNHGIISMLALEIPWQN